VTFTAEEKHKRPREQKKDIAQILGAQCTLRAMYSRTAAASRAILSRKEIKTPRELNFEH